MAVQTSDLCPDDKLRPVLEAVERSNEDGLKAIETLSASYGRDPRLRFLHGSVLASLQRYSEAMRQMQSAVEIAPDYPIARFQLGLLQLTSGEAQAALTTWGPLAILPEDQYLSLFVRGLQSMIRDEFGKAIDLLQAGIQRNNENLPMNRDMSLLIETMKEAMAKGDQDGPQSAVQLLLQQSRSRGALN